MVSLSSCSFLQETFGRIIPMPAKKEAKEEVAKKKVTHEKVTKTTTKLGSVSELLKLMNEARAKKGRKLLVMDARLMRAAQAHSESMSKHGYFSHKGKDGSSFPTRMLREGYPRCYSAENIALAPSAESANNQWQKSSQHKKNLFGKKYTRVGIGQVGRYWTAIYAVEPNTPEQ